MTCQPCRRAAYSAVWLVSLLGLCVLSFRLTAAAQHAPKVPLIEAVQRGDVAATQRLLDAGANPNAREVLQAKPTDDEGVESGKPHLWHTALILATESGNLELVRPAY